MKVCPTLFCLFLSFSTFAQNAFYQGFEADTAAEPRGGMSYLTTFIQTNLRKPMAAEAKGVGGRVIVSGIVETDGHISEVKAMNSFRPDCDQEAVRVFKRFNAWKPAYKNGKPVRQQVVIPIVFKASTPFTYERGARVSYFNADNKPVADSSQARYKQLAPIDSAGIPTGDIVLYKAKGSSWKEEVRLPLLRKEFPMHDSPGKKYYLVGYQNGMIQWEGQQVSLDEQGRLMRQSYYQNGKPVGTEFTYHPNGLVAQKIEDFDAISVVSAWYPNGQIKQIRTRHKVKPLEITEPEQVTSYWDSTGRQYVAEGNGRVTYQTDVRSRIDSVKHTLFTEQGGYKDGYRQGIWTGQYADGSYFYEESYDKGICLVGKARTAGSDTVRYAEIEKQPEFKGGMQGLGQFLSQNLRYPANAQRAGAQGKVFISFVVCTDGSLCDYEVLKGAHPELDREALRVVKEMNGRWKPGVQRGEKVRVKYNMPINFSLY